MLSVEYHWLMGQLIAIAKHNTNIWVQKMLPMSLFVVAISNTGNLRSDDHNYWNTDLITLIPFIWIAGSSRQAQITYKAACQGVTVRQLIITVN